MSDSIDRLIVLDLEMNALRPGFEHTNEDKFRMLGMRMQHEQIVQLERIASGLEQLNSAPTSLQFAELVDEIKGIHTQLLTMREQPF